MHEDSAQMLLAQAVVVAEVIALVLEGVEGLVLDPPAGTATPHDLHGIVRGDLNVGYPTEAVEDHHILAPGFHLPVLEEVDLQLVLTGLVEGHGVDEAKTVRLVCLCAVGQEQFDHFSPFGRCVDLAEHVGMISGLGREDVAEIMGHQILDVRGVGAQAILGDDDLQMRVFPPEIGDKASGGVPLAIVFGGAVLPSDEFRAERQHLLAARRNKGPSNITMSVSFIIMG